MERTSMIIDTREAPWLLTCFIIRHDCAQLTERAGWSLWLSLLIIFCLLPLWYLRSESDSGLVAPLFFFPFYPDHLFTIHLLAIWSPSVSQICVRCWSYKWVRSLCSRGACSIMRDTNHECDRETRIQVLSDGWRRRQPTLRDGTPYLSSHRWLMTELKLKRSFGSRKLASCHHLLPRHHTHQSSPLILSHPVAHT